MVIADKHFDGLADADAIYALGVNGLIIERCTFANVGAAIRLVECTNVTVRDCAFYNILGGPPGFGDGGTGNFVQTDKCNDVTVEYCWGVNDENGNPEDIISIFVTSIVTVRGCQFWGGGPSESGSGILVGDGSLGGDSATIVDNVLVDTGQVGIGVNGGDLHVLLRNKILGSTRPISNVGIYVWDGGDGSTLGSVDLTDNKVMWSSSDGGVNPKWFPHGVITESGNDYFALSLQDSNPFNPSGYYGWEA